ncbi:unnamed protein product [Bursaphelenchus okinawaensis]|uniref:Protein kinase domain-containing protein n=1 Tax=Bursaphelenchus okinawaensis TaxID=465554 RepID=A0A811LVB4_9BILA|nr:unnamed protein product [Bursaphelenchus okinawaensis]CAG9128228.1 unnamed protein product [Bursaphelenchus okinawaensis]
MTSSSEGEILQSNQIIRERWKIKCKLGGGGFGEIYEALDMQNHNERVAVKVESAKATKQVLKMEVAVLRRLQGKKHACKFYGCGRNERYNYLVMSLQGKNLADLRRESPKQCFSVSTALRLASQILVSIKEIHSIGFLHRDVKPSNFAMGRTSSTMRVVYMLDFGLARLYLNNRGEIRSPRTAAGFRGTVRYAAVSAHKNKEMGRQDDLWSLFYMLVEFLQGALPWRRIKDKDEVGRMKDEADPEKLLEGCPVELLAIPKHLKTLGYPDEPNYSMLESVLWSCMARLSINMDDPYDWEIGYENISGRSKTTSSTTNNGNASTRMRSHTTAVRDVQRDEKNRGMDTQAPITMGEDEDEQTGNYNYKFPALGSMKSSQHEADGHERPKYKRQEFMRPKYGAVSFDVIDAVNARLAAASSAGEVGTRNGPVHLMNRLRIETSVENDPKYYNPVHEKVELTIGQPGNYSTNQLGSTGQNQNVGQNQHGASGTMGNQSAVLSQNGAQNQNSTQNQLGTQSLYGTQSQHGTQHGTQNQNLTPNSMPNSTHNSQNLAYKENNNNEKKSQKSLTLSIGKKYQNGKRNVTPSNTTNAVADDDGIIGKDISQNKGQTIVSKWQDSFDDSVDEENLNGLERSMDGGRSPGPPRYVRSKQIATVQAQTPANGLPSSTTLNGDLAGYLSPRSGRRLITSSKSTAPLLNVSATIQACTPKNQSIVAPSEGKKEKNGQKESSPGSNGGGGLMSHLKGLVNSFNTASSNALGHVRKRSLSRGISLDDARQRQQQQQQLQPTTPNSTATTPTSGLGSASSTSSHNGPHSPSSSRRLTVEEEEREIRRRRRLRRRSDCQGMIPGNRMTDGSISPARALHPAVIYSATPVDAYNRLVNNGVVVSSVRASTGSESPFEERKNSCRKRYPFLSFAPRAMSRS